MIDLGSSNSGDKTAAAATFLTAQDLARSVYRAVFIIHVATVHDASS